MAKAKRQTKVTKSPTAYLSECNSAPTALDNMTDPAANPGTKSRVIFSFPVLRDLLLLLCEKQPWRAEHGRVGPIWESIARTLNDRHSLNPAATAQTIRNKTTSLRKLHEVSRFLKLPHQIKPVAPVGWRRPICITFDTYC